MSTKQITIERWSIVSSKPVDEILSAIDIAIGHPDIRQMQKSIAAASSFAEMESIVQPLAGPTGLMKFMQLDFGEVISKGRTGKAIKSLRLLIGNPLIMRQMTELVPDTGSYAPVTILIDERADGVHLSYDTMASLLASYKNSEASKIAADLDSKVEALLTRAAGN